MEPLYQLNESPELSPRLSLHPDVQHKNIALPKTFTTRKGALLLFSEEFANKTQESNTKEHHHGQEHVLDSLDHVDLKTVDDFAKCVLAYGSGVSLKFISICVGFTGMLCNESVLVSLSRNGNCLCAVGWLPKSMPHRS